MTDKEVDYFLKVLEKSDYKITSFDKDVDLDNFDAEKVVETLNKSFHIRYLIEELKLIKHLQELGNTGIYGLTKKGRKVVRIGGWLKYIERKDRIEEKKELKQDYELKIAEFQAENPRLPYYIAFGSFIIAVFSFINSCSIEKQKSEYKQQKKPYKKEVTISKTNNLVDSTSLLKKK